MHRFSSLSAGFLALTLASAAVADPIVLDDGPFLAGAGAREIVTARTGASLGEARLVAFASDRAVVRLPQIHHGLPVALRGATVAFGKDGRARMLSMRLEDALDDDVTPVVSAASAAEIASGRARMPIDASRATLAIWPTTDGARLAWVVYPEPSPALAYAPIVVVDAKGGEILTAYDAKVALDQAKVYPSNPTKSPDLVQVTLPVGSGETTLQSELVRSYNCIDKKSVKTVFNLPVHTCDLVQTALPDASGDYFVTPGTDTDPEDPFSEVSMFYHANHAYDLFRSFSPEFVVQAAPLDTVSNLRLPAGYETLDTAKMADPDIPLVPFQNAFFAPSNPIFSQVFGLTGAAMWFGQGPKRDYAYDGDVIYHEFTHSVVAATVNLVGFAHADMYGLSQSPGGMNEGLADYFSSAITGDPDVGEYAAADIGGLDKIRSLADPDSCPADIGGEVHQDATLFSGGLWDVRSTLPADSAATFDMAIFEAMNTAPTGDLGYEEFATLMVESVKASKLGSKVADALTAAFTKRGVLPGCKRILEYAGSPLSGPAKLGNVWMSPGLAATNLGKAPYAPGIIQVHSALLEFADSVTVKLTATTAAGGGLGPQGTPFAPELLVRFGADPVTFAYGPFAAAEGTLVVPLTKSDTTYTATVTDVPAGSTDVYVMLVNTGDQDGAYTALEISNTASPPGDDQPVPDQPGPAAKQTATGPADDSGCGRRAPGSTGTPEGVGLVALALGSILVRRSRRVVGKGA